SRAGRGGRGGSSPRGRRPGRRGGPAWRRSPPRTRRHASSGRTPIMVVWSSYNNVRSHVACERRIVSEDVSEPHLIHFDVRPLSFEEPIHGLVLAAPEQHEYGLTGAGHLDRPAESTEIRVPVACCKRSFVVPSGPIKTPIRSAEIRA